MADYTPTTEQVRTEWIESGNDSPTNRLRAGAAFDRWLAAHDAQVRADAVRKFADVVQDIADLGAANTGLRTPQDLAEYAANYAARIAREHGAP